MAYDELSAVYTARRIRWAIAAFTVPIMWFEFNTLMTCSAFFHALTQGQPTGPSAFQGIVFLLAAGFLVFWFVVVYRMFRYGHVIAVTANGLFLRTRALRSFLIPWSQIEHATPQKTPARRPQSALVVQRQRGGDFILGGLAGFFPSRDDVERFCAGVNAKAAAARHE